MKQLKLSAPWETFVTELEVLFGGDPDINIRYESKARDVKLFVDGERKAAALAKILPTEKVFGNETLKIEVVPANSKDEGIADIYKDAFDGNPVLDEVLTMPMPFGDGQKNYVMFARQVVQFYNDDLSDPNGVETTLYENIARDVFVNQGGESYSTSNAHHRARVYRNYEPEF